MTVDLSEQEWNQVVAILASAPWSTANPLLMRIGQQLQPQKNGPARDPYRHLDDPDVIKPPS